MSKFSKLKNNLVQNRYFRFLQHKSFLLFFVLLDSKLFVAIETLMLKYGKKFKTSIMWIIDELQIFSAEHKIMIKMKY